VSEPRDHRARVDAEFTRQARPFAEARVLRAPELTTAIVEALGSAARGDVVDLASGPGVVTESLAVSAQRVVALDLTAATLELARERVRDAGHRHVRFVRGDVTRAPLAAERFDGAVLRLALHHFANPGAAVATAHTLLRPGGRLVVLDLLSPEDPEDRPLHAALERLRDPSHVDTLTGEALQALAAASGFGSAQLRTWSLERRFEEWARIIDDPVRTDALELVMRALARRGVEAGIGLRETDGDLRFDYRFGLLVAHKAGPHA
jgi:SAM-dependent methyltransferase